MTLSFGTESLLDQETHPVLTHCPVGVLPKEVSKCSWFTNQTRMFSVLLREREKLLLAWPEGVSDCPGDGEWRGREEMTPRRPGVGDQDDQQAEGRRFPCTEAWPMALGSSKNELFHIKFPLYFLKVMLTGKDRGHWFLPWLGECPAARGWAEWRAGAIGR